MVLVLSCYGIGEKADKTIGTPSSYCDSASVAHGGCNGDSCVQWQVKRARGWIEGTSLRQRSDQVRRVVDRQADSKRISWRFFIPDNVDTEEVDYTVGCRLGSEGACAGVGIRTSGEQRAAECSPHKGAV